MINTDKKITSTGKQIYNELKATIEVKYPNQYISIEPISGEYWVDKHMGNAIAKGKARYPSRTFYTTAIGEPLHIPLI